MQRIETLSRLTTISSEASIAEAAATLNRAATDRVLLRQQNGVFIGSLTSRQIRQAMLAGQSFDAPCGVIADFYSAEATPPVDEQVAVYPSLARASRLSEQLPVSAVIMAGGFGTRLRPLTDDTPKPLLPIGGRPIMELIVEQVRQAGIKHCYVSTYYMPEKIMDYFGDGREFGVDITYVHEETPLGTAGALGLIENHDQPLLIINGDILTKLDFRAMWNFHCRHQAALTMGVRQYEYQIPYGVIESDGPHVHQIQEKPRQQALVNAGIYLLQPDVLRRIPQDQRLDMTDLLTELLNNEETVVNFPIIEYWLDIGQHADYQKAQQDIQDW